MRILVTGSEGFLGKHLVRSLSEDGRSVTGIDLALFDRHDIRGDLAWVKLENYDACVHLAAIAAPDKCKKDPSLAFETNVRGTHNVLRLCERLNIRRFIFMSSAHVYGISPKYMPTPESHPLALHDTYTTTKILGEQLCELFWQNHGIAYTCIRLFNAYGPGQSPDYFLGVKLRQANAGGPLTVRNASVTKDWIYIGDVIRAIQLALESDFVGPVNIGTGIETSLGQLVERIAQGFNLPIVTEEDDPSGPSRMRANIDRAKTVLSWEPQIAVEEGLSKLWG